jgi:hypothetical protein
MKNRSSQSNMKRLRTVMCSTSFRRSCVKAALYVVAVLRTVPPQPRLLSTATRKPLSRAAATRCVTYSARLLPVIPYNEILKAQRFTVKNNQCGPLKFIILRVDTVNPVHGNFASVPCTSTWYARVKNSFSDQRSLVLVQTRQQV